MIISKKNEKVAQLPQKIQEQSKIKQQIEEQKKEFEKKMLVEQQNKRAFEKAINTLMALYSKWQDAEKIANVTARIALAGPVGDLQQIKRDADALEVPECMAQTKNKLTRAMGFKINNFLFFMENISIKPDMEGVINLARKIDEAKKIDADNKEAIDLFKEFETESKTACGDLQDQK